VACYTRIPRFIRIGSGVEKLLGTDTHIGIETHIKREKSNHINLIYFSK
jgi:hypothetical protein